MKKTIQFLIGCILALSVSFSAQAQAWFPDSTWYRDIDGDGFGTISTTTKSATKPTGYVKNAADCDDAIPNQTAWGRVGKRAFSSAQPINSNMDIAVGPTGTAYMVFIPTGNTFPTAMKKAAGDSVWSVIDIVEFTRRGTSPTQSSTECAIAVDSKDTVWVGIIRSGGAEVWRYHPSANSGMWMQLGSDLQAVGASHIDIVIGKKDTVMAFYRHSNRPKAKELKRPSTWDAIPEGASNEIIINSAVNPSYNSIAADKNGVAYAAYQASSNGQATVYKVNTTNDGWTSLGTATPGANTAAKADSLKLIVDTSGTPYLLFKDYGNSRKASVRRYNGSSWETVGSLGFSTGAITGGDIAVNRQTNEVYVAYGDSGRSNNVIVQKFNGTSWEDVLSAEESEPGCNVVMDIVNGIPYVLYQATSRSFLATAVRRGPSRIWMGAQNTSWSDARNWCGYDSPDTSESVTFKAVTTNEPTAPSGTTVFSSFQIQTNDTLTIASGSTFAIKKQLLNAGMIKGDGEVLLRGSSAQVISGKGTIHNITYNNASGVSILSGDTQNITGTLTPTAGTFTTNNGLLLKSSASGTARIAQGSGSYISGNVSVERYIPGGRRAMRYFSHPFTTALPLTAMTGAGEIDITGTGGATNGFTNTNTNAGSSWWYDPVKGDESTVNDIGWTYFMSAYGGDTNDWKQHQAIKVLVRGTKGQGLNTTNYTPSPAKFTMTGEVNTGSQVVTATKGAISGYNLIGNPFPSQIDLSATTRGVNIENNFWVWNPNGGTKGIFESNPFSIGMIPLNYVLPAYSGFFVRTTANSGNTITFPESCKVADAPNSLFKTTAVGTYAELRITDSANVFWDKYMLILDSATVAGKDVYDAKKFFNSEMNFYSFSAQKDSLAIDARPFDTTDVVHIDMWTGLKGKFMIDVAKLGMAPYASLILRDNYAKVDTVLSEGVKYPFTINNDSLSFSKRFELRFRKDEEPSKVANASILKSFDVTLSPNPATAMVNITVGGDKGQPVLVRMSDVMGRVVYQNIHNAANATGFTVPVESFAAGVYNVELIMGDHRVVKQLVKQ